MAKIKPYIELVDTGGNTSPGKIVISLTKPLIQYHLTENNGDDNRWNNEMVFTVNGVNYLGQSEDKPYDFGDNFKDIYLNFDYDLGNQNPSEISSGKSSASSPYSVNPAYPVDTVLGKLITPSYPSSYDYAVNSEIYFYFFNNNWFRLHDHRWRAKVNLRYIDNVFLSRSPKFTVINEGTAKKYVEIKMSHNFSQGYNNTDGNLPPLIRSDLDEIDLQLADHYIACDGNTLTYKLPWNENTAVPYALMNAMPTEYTHDTPSDTNISKSNTTTIVGTGNTSDKTKAFLEVYNNALTFKTIQLATPTSFSIDLNKLSWSAVPNASTYSIYVDGKFYESIKTNYWEIPDELFSDNIHTYSVKVDSYIKETHTTRINSGKPQANYTDKTLHGIRNSFYTIYGGTTLQTPDKWKNIGILQPPTVSFNRTTLNSYTFTLSHTSDAPDTKLYYKLGETGILTEILDNVLSVDRLKVNKSYDYYFYTSATVNSVVKYSDPTIITITPSKYPKPSITKVSKTAINAYEVTFTSTAKPDRFDIYLNGVIYKANVTSPVIVPGWVANASNKIKVESVFEADTSYNNSITQTYGSSYTPVLKTPNLTKKDIKENNVEQSFGDAGSKEILNNVTTKVELSWTGIEYASGYVLYDNYKVWNNDIEDWEEGQRVYPTQTTSDGTEYMAGTLYTLYMDNVQGYHTYSIQAIAAQDEAYNSYESNSITLEQNFPLEAPLISGDDSTTTISFDRVPNADFYSIQLIPTTGTTKNLFRSFIPEKFPFTYNYYDMVKDLTETETFIISVFSRSYNAFYFHPSADSNKKSLNVYKLNKPVNLQYDDVTGDLTWTGDSRAFQYEIKIKATDGDWATYYTKDTHYTFENLAPSLYTVYVTALRDDSLTNNQPVYLDSVKSDNLSFGLLNIPKDFSRHVNVLSWTTVGADRYIVFEDGKSLTTVDGGGLSLELGMVSGAKYRPTEGTHTYTVQAVTTIDGVEYKSLQSDPITVDITYLQTVEPYYTTPGYAYISWVEKDNNVVYDTRVNNLSEKDLSNENLYTMDKDEEGSYYFKVRAVSTIDEFLYQTSEFSEELLYTVTKLSRPEVTLKITEDPESEYDKYVFSWDAVTNATSYSVVVNYNGEETSYLVSTTEYTFFPEAGNYSIRVYANGSTSDYPNPKYITSENSNIIKFGKLEAPVITIEENVISWEPNELADYYEIYNYGEYFSQTDETKFILDVSRPYSYSISVKAISNEELIKPSNPSNSIQYTIVRLNSPQNVKINDSTLTWDLVLNADAYRIYIDDELTVITSGTKYNLNNILTSRSGVLRIHVTAFSNKINFLESDPSNYVMKRIEKEKKYNIIIENTNYDKIQLPFTMNFTLDETLDTAGITLAYLDRSEPFERLTPADIVIYESAGASRRFPMVVESDNVVEVQIGTEIKYKHIIQLIERTILLQNEIIPDFTISSSVRDIINRNYDVISASIGKNTALDRMDLAGVGTFDIAELPLDWLISVLKAIADLLNLDIADDIDDIPEDLRIPMGVAWFTGITKDGEVDSVLSKKLRVGETFVLPNPTTRLSCCAISIKSLLNNILELLGLGDWDDLGGVAGALGIKELAEIAFKAIKKIAKVAGKLAWIVAVIVFLIEYIIYMIKILIGKRGYSWEGLLEKLMTTDLSVIGDIFYTDSDWAFPERKYYIRPTKSSYGKTSDEELIYTAPAGFANTIGTYAFPKEGNYDLIMEIPAVNMDKLFDKGLIDFDSSILKYSDKLAADLPTSINYMKDSNGNPTTYRVVWHNINITRENVSAKHKKISEVLEKIMALTNNKYTMDPKIIKFTNTIECPDMTFSNGNYLYDVLETIGREFYGIPRLLADNVITFDILDNTTFSSTQMSFWKDTKVVSAKSQDLDMVASGFISRVSNMIPDDDYTIYPAPDMWIYPRSDDTDIAAVYIESMAVSLDKPIYKINKVFVKNAITEMPDLILDISNYVYQDTVYYSLNNNRNGKGMALVWKQGDTFIRGLGQLPEANKFYSFMGWNPDEYVIDNIINDYCKKNIDKNVLEKFTVGNPADLLFQVEYQGYTDTTLYVENPDKKNSKYSMYSVFNQEDNTISDTRFGNGALSILKRHNTNIVQREYQSYSLINLPLLGSKLDIDNAPYYIDELKYEFNNSYIIATCNFSKNYNKINPRTAISSEYRQYELRSDNNVNRVLNFNEYCILGDKDASVNSITIKSNWEDVLYNSLKGNTSIKPECFYINCYKNTNLDKISYKTVDTAGTELNKTIDGIALPISYSRLGSSINFSAGMVDSFSAGYTAKRENTKEDNLERVQSYVRYVGDDSSDQTPYMRLTLASLSSTIKNYKTTEKVGKENIPVSVSNTFPSVPWLTQPTVSLNSPYFSKFFKVYKDQRETLKFNYQMHFVSNRDDLFIHKGFTKYLFRSPRFAEKGTTPILVGYTTDISNKDILSTPYTDKAEISTFKDKVLFKTFTSTKEYKGLALIWPDTKEILLEIRKPVAKGVSYTPDAIYFNFSDKIKR